MRRTRPDKIWTIALKEFSEFRRNRYIVYSLILMPLIMTTILPMVYLLPVASFASDPPDQPMNLGIETVEIVYGGTVLNGYYNHTFFIGVTLGNIVALSCRFVDCEMNYCLVRNSDIMDSSLSECVVDRCNLENVSRFNVSLKDSRVLGEPTEAESTLLLLLDAQMLFFALIPTIIPTIIASYTMVGEKLNRSLEPLLATPTSDLEILTGKVVSILLPSMLVTWICFVPFVVIVNLIAGPVLDYLPLPDLTWIVVVFLLGPLFCLVSILGNVIISSRVNDVRSAQQLGSLVILPIVGFFAVALLGAIALTLPYLLTVALVMICVDITLFYLATRIFGREEILVRWR
ncbi:MAG TPA: ABC transporter permease subunit [Methanomassiliicoccales archaeon]|nr:ABC transporter permease subunit [Methanomassiliicoccales archaeon]